MRQVMDCLMWPWSSPEPACPSSLRQLVQHQSMLLFFTSTTGWALLWGFKSIPQMSILHSNNRSS